MHATTIKASYLETIRARIENYLSKTILEWVRGGEGVDREEGSQSYRVVLPYATLLGALYTAEIPTRASSLSTLYSVIPSERCLCNNHSSKS